MTNNDSRWNECIEHALAAEPELEPSPAFTRRVLASSGTDAYRESRFAPAAFPWRHAGGVAAAVLVLGALGPFVVAGSPAPDATSSWILAVSTSCAVGVATLLGLLRADLVGD